MKYLKKQNKLFSFLVVTPFFAISLVACATTAPQETTSTSSLSVHVDSEPKDPFTKEEAVSLITSIDASIDNDFAGWLYDYDKESVFNIISDSSVYDSKTWYYYTGNSLHLLYDMYAGNPLVYFETAVDNVVNLGFAGDVSLAPDYSHAIAYANGGIDAAFPGEIQDAMKAPDVFFVNNEFCYSNRGAPQPGKTYTFRAPPERVNWLFEMGVDLISLANNHAFDYGEDAFYDTLETLESAGMPYMGGGYNIKDASSPLYVSAGGLKIAYISATEIEGHGFIFSKGATEDSPGLFRFNDPNLLIESIRQAKENSDFVIVIPHWGTERIQPIQEHQQYIGKVMADAGADVIIGGHPHVIQGVENYNESTIFYSLGNFCFNDRITDSCILYLNLTIDGIESARFLPCTEIAGATRLCEKGSSDYNRIIEEFNIYSASGISVDEDGFVISE